MNIKLLLGNKIKEIRKHRKMTQEQLAECVGIETSSISNIENGKYYPSAENLNNIIQTLDINPFDLLISEYHAEPKILLNELVTAMNKNEKLLKQIYKYYMTIKYQDF